MSLRPETYVSIARRKDAAAGIEPWTFSESNPGWNWLLEKQEQFLEDDAERDPTVLSEAVSAGPVSSSKSYQKDTTNSRTDIIEQAITLYQSGRTSRPDRTVAVFGRYRP